MPSQLYKKTFLIEARSDLGGTWDQMTFPGVRSDTDMYTYGYSFNPWQGSIIGMGEEIKQYQVDTAEKFNIKENILFNTLVKSLSWKNKTWITKTNKESFLSRYVNLLHWIARL